MLILTRRIGESIIINNDITITVLGIQGNQVRIGVQAPKDLPVHRHEVQERIDEERLQASKASAIKKKLEISC